MQETTAEQTRLRFLANRVLIVLAVAATLVGLAFDHWSMVLQNALYLCFVCIGLE